MYRRQVVSDPIVKDVVLFNSCGTMYFDDHIVQSITPHWDQAEEVMREYRGRMVLLLEGGADIDPSLYGQENRHSYPSQYRDRREVVLYNLARSLDIPVLGNCRGHQLVAALNGGTLHQDIRTDLGIKGHGDGWLDLEGVFAAWYPNGYHANSAHHQCVDRVPENAIVVARDKKNPQIIEALAYPNGCSISKTRMFTVQFHPEFMGDHELLQHIVNWLFEE